MNTGITPAVVIGVLNLSAEAAKIDGAQQGSPNFNRLYVLTCWGLGLKVGKKASAKFAKENPGVAMPKGRKLLYSVPGSPGDVASALAGAINTVSNMSNPTEAPAPQAQAEKPVPTTHVIRALPTLVVEMNGGEKALYGNVRRAIRNGATTAEAITSTLTPESQGTLAFMVQQGQVAPDAIPGLRLSVATA